jgi:hypothetical protein
VRRGDTPRWGIVPVLHNRQERRAPPATMRMKESTCDVPPSQIASIDALLVTRSFLLPSLDICKKASTP